MIQKNNNNNAAHHLYICGFQQGQQVIDAGGHIQPTI